LTSDRKTHNVEIYSLSSPTAISSGWTHHHTVIGRTKEQWLKPISFTFPLVLWLPTDKDCDYFSIETHFENSFSVEQEKKKKMCNEERE